MDTSSSERIDIPAECRYEALVDQLESQIRLAHGSSRPGNQALRLGGALLLALGLTSCAGWPMRLGRLAPHASPAPAGNEWSQLLADLRQADQNPIYREVCHSTYLPGAPGNPDVVILLHGLTNCPAQFRPLGEQIVAATGSHVLIPRIDFHGEKDRMSTTLNQLTAEMLVAMSERVTLAAQSRGGRVGVIGLSLGATMAAWIAQNYEVDRAIVIAPILGIPGVPRGLLRPLTSYSRLRHDRFRWWDPESREDLAGPPYAYPRYSVSAAGELLRLGLQVDRAATRAAPAARSIVLVSNESDKAVNQDDVDRLLRSWQAHAPGRVKTYVFAKAAALDHDIIDPHNPQANPELTFGVIVKLLQSAGF